MAPRFLFLPLSLLLSAVGLSSAAPSATTQQACDSIRSILSGKVRYPGDAAYIKENKDYYNIGLAELRPGCIAFPTSAQDVSSIIKILSTHGDVPFAIKSGGHSPNPGASSVKDGVLITTRHINGTVLDKEKSLAYIKPGGHWWDAMDVLNGTGHMVVGGRLGVVGIGGYLLQGGVSLLSGLYGLGGDNVIEYETVVANGSIININAKEHKDLVRAMRGGGSQFGIVTKFTVRTYPVKNVWVGARTVNCTRDQFNDALQDFIANMNDYPRVATISPLGMPSGGMGKGGIFGSLGGIFGVSRTTQESQIYNVMHALSGGSLFSLGSSTHSELLEASSSSSNAGSPGRFAIGMAYVDEQKPPKEAWGKKFNSLPSLGETGSIISYHDAIRVSNFAFDYFSMRTSFRSFTVPVQLDNPAFIGEIEDIFSKISATYTKKLKGFGGLGIVLQPFPHAFGKAADDRGGNAMGLTSQDHDRFVLEIAGVYSSKADDELMQAWGAEFTSQLTSHLKTALANAKAKGLSVGEYNPYFMNDAGTDQNVMGSYKDSKKFAALQKELDPHGLFSKRAGGFKLDV